MPRILVLDDELLISAMVEDWLTELNYEVVGPASSVAGALDIIDAKRPDAAILDLSLDGEESYPVADALRALRIPFAFVTGHEPGALTDRFRDAPLLAKPFDLHAVKATIDKLLDASAGN